MSIFKYSFYIGVSLLRGFLFYMWMRINREGSLQCGKHTRVFYLPAAKSAHLPQRSERAGRSERDLYKALLYFFVGVSPFAYLKSAYVLRKRRIYCARLQSAPAKLCFRELLFEIHRACMNYSKYSAKRTNWPRAWTVVLLQFSSFVYLSSFRFSLVRFSMSIFKKISIWVVNTHRESCN